MTRHHINFSVTVSVDDEQLTVLRAAYQKAYQSDTDDDWQAFHDEADAIVGMFAIDIGVEDDRLLLEGMEEPCQPCGSCGDTGEVRWTDHEGDHGPFPCEDCSK